MEARDYCSAMRTEVDSWRSKAHDTIGKFTDVPEEEMEKLRPFLSELKAVVEEHTARLENLSEECPADFAGQKAKNGKFAETKKGFWNRRREGEYQWYRPHL